MAKGKDAVRSEKIRKECGHKPSSKKHRHNKPELAGEESDEWVEKELPGGPASKAAPVPIPDPTTTDDGQQDKQTGTAGRESWMLSSTDQAARQGGAVQEDDYFGRLGTLGSSRPNKEKEILAFASEKKAQPQSPGSIKRLGAGDPDYQPSAQPTQTPIIPGGPGYQWRLTKLRRTYDTAKEENRAIEDVALERYGTLEAWEQANEERQIVEDRRHHAGHESGRSTPRQDSSSSSYERRYMFTNQEGRGSASRPSSRASFRKPTSALNTPEGGRLANNRRVDEIRAGSSTSNPVSPSPSGPSTPIPSVINPLANRAANKKPPATTTTLNKLQASILIAKMMDPDAVPDLERQYKEARESQKHAEQTIELIPSLDARGRMYDIGAGIEAAGASSSTPPGNKRKKDAKFETRDQKTGELLRFNPDDDQISLGQMVRQEKLQAGAADQKDFDVEMASRIMGDAKFENDLDYMDDNADRLARKKMKTDASKRLFAINDYARTRKALESCEFCFGDDGAPPANLGIISRGPSVFLCCPRVEELVEGHCWIVPIQHCLSSLELDDDVWDEIKNFMKCLMRMFAEKHDKGVVFYETVLSFKHQLHTYIEAVPVPWDLFNDIPAYFRESINASGAEWTQHRKLIDFSARAGGFRRAMVAKLPYFMVQWDYRGEKGFGHVIEDNDQHAGGANAGAELEEHTGIVDDGLKGTAFPRYFAAEILGNLLDLEPHKWRKPKRIGPKNPKQGGGGTGSGLATMQRTRVERFLHQLGYARFDWTGSVLT